MFTINAQRSGHNCGLRVFFYKETIMLTTEKLNECEKVFSYCLWTQESEDMPELELPPSSSDLGIDTQLALEAITVYETLRQGCSCFEN